MPEVIELEYKVAIDGLKAQMKQAEERLKGVEDTAKKSAQNTEKHFQSAGEGIKHTAKEIAISLGLAFGVEKLVEFSKGSVKAFLEAERNANRLSFAVTKIGGEGQAAFKKLLEQSEKLQGISIFSDDSIQQAQTQLAQLGLNSDQIEALIPKILDLASATGDDLGTATEKAIQAINGQTRGLKSVGLAFNDTGDKTKNLALLTEGLNKFQGATAGALETTEGKAKRLENAFDDLKEKIGGLIVTEGNELLDFFDVLGGGFDKVFLGKGRSALGGALSEASAKLIEEAKTSETERRRILAESFSRALSLEASYKKAQSNLERQSALDRLTAERDLQKELINLNNPKNNLGLTTGGQSAADAAAKKALDDAAKAKADAAKALTEFDKQVQEDLLKSQAQTDLQKLELIRDTSLKELEIRTEAARAAGVAEKDIAESTNKDIAAIFERFNIDKTALETTQNEKDFQEAIAVAEKEGDALAAIEEENQKKRLKKIKDAADERKHIEEETIQTISSILGSIQTISSNITQQRVDEVQQASSDEIAILDDELANKEISQKQYTDKRAAIEKKAAEETKKLQQENFERQKQIQLIGATIDTAKGVAGALAQTGELGYGAFVLAALVLAAGAAEVAAISSQPSPKFAKGVVGLKGRGTGTSDEIPAWLSKGESVITAEATEKNKGLLLALNKGKGQEYIMKHLVAPALMEQKKKLQKQAEETFASNITKSLMLNSKGFYDGNIVDRLKAMQRQEKDLTTQLIGAIKSQKPNMRKF